jgi:hypothetical protein
VRSWLGMQEVVVQDVRGRMGAKARIHRRPDVRVAERVCLALRAGVSDWREVEGAMVGEGEKGQGQRGKIPTVFLRV